MKKLIALAALSTAVLTFGLSSPAKADHDSWRGGGYGYRGGYGGSYRGGWGRGPRWDNRHHHHHHHHHHHRHGRVVRPYGPAYRNGVVIVTPGFGFSYGGW